MELGVRAPVVGVDLFRESHLVSGRRRAGGYQWKHPDLLPRVTPLVEHEMVLEHVHPLDQGGVAGGDEVGGAAAAGTWHPDHPEVDRSIVGENQEVTPVMLGGVFDSFPAGQEHPPVGCGLIRRRGSGLLQWCSWSSGPGAGFDPWSCSGRE